MKKAELIKLLDKYPANKDVVFKVGSESYHSLRLEVEHNYDVVTIDFDDDGNEFDVPAKVEKTTYTRLVLE